MFQEFNKMVMYKCINGECQKLIDSQEVRRRVRCPYCGHKMLSKPKTTRSIVPAR